MHCLKKSIESKRNQHLFMGVAWLIPDRYEMFKNFPQAIHVNGTVSTNKENYILMTVSAKDRSHSTKTLL